MLIDCESNFTSVKSFVLLIFPDFFSFRNKCGVTIRNLIIRLYLKKNQAIMVYVSEAIPLASRVIELNLLITVTYLLPPFKDF